MTISAMIANWKPEAGRLRRRGLDAQAKMVDSFAIELEAWWREYQLETLTLEQSVKDSGYGYSALEKMVRTGRVPNAGKPGAPRIRRCDLPKKPGASRVPSAEGPDLAGLVLGSRERSRSR